MKITDQELLDAIWANQLRLLSRSVLQNYIGGGVGVCEDRDHSYHNTSSEHRRSRERVTTKIGRKQLMIRLNQIYIEGEIRAEWDYNNTLLVFMIDSDESRKAFRSARQFWLDNGVPTGYSILSDGRHSSNTTKDVDVAALLPECKKMMAEKYGSRKGLD